MLCALEPSRTKTRATVRTRDFASHKVSASGTSTDADLASGRFSPQHCWLVSQGKADTSVRCADRRNTPLEATVDTAPVGHTQCKNHEFSVLHGANDPIISDADSPQI